MSIRTSTCGAAFARPGPLFFNPFHAIHAIAPLGLSALWLQTPGALGVHGYKRLFSHKVLQRQMSTWSVCSSRSQDMLSVRCGNVRKWRILSLLSPRFLSARFGRDLLHPVRGWNGDEDGRVCQSHIFRLHALSSWFLFNGRFSIMHSLSHRRMAGSDRSSFLQTLCSWVRMMTEAWRCF